MNSRDLSLTNLYNMPKDMLVKLISTIQEEKEKEIQSRLKLFHVKCNEPLGYESFSDFVCVAENEEVARNIYPNGCQENWESGAYGRAWINKTEIDKLVVKEIGIASNNMKSGDVICASFLVG